MKKLIVPASLALSVMLCLSGCVAAFGNRGALSGDGTVGQQLIDLHQARKCNAINDAEYASLKAKVLE